MEICAIVINYLNLDKTSQCIRSIQDQNIDTLYLVDNSNSEAEARRVIALSEYLQANGFFLKIHVLVNSRNLGFGKAINNAIRCDIKNGGHGYYLLLNNDAVAAENMVDKLLSVLRNDRNIYMVSPSIVTAEKKVITYYWYNKIFGFVTASPQTQGFCYLSGCCLLLKKDIVNQGTLFDEDFFMYGEDVCLCKRLKEEGKGYACIDDVFVFHEGSGSSINGSLFYEYHVSRGHIILSSKICNNIQKIFCYFGRVTYLSVRCLKRALLSKSSVPIIAFVLSWLPSRLVAKIKFIDSRLF